MQLEILLATMVAGIVINFFRNLWGSQSAPPRLLEATLSETDEKMCEKTRELIQEVFGENVVESVKAMDSLKRLEKANEFANRLVKAYGLETEVTFYGENRNDCGGYNFRENKIYLNVADLFIRDEEHFAEYLLNFFDTIIHELRHAVQHKAVLQEGFWEVDEDTRLLWADNIAHYHSPKVDIKAYVTQPIEMDARTFAARSMKGVFEA